MKNERENMRRNNAKSIFHVHTYRCQHASNERELDYIKMAIEIGANKIVFTDHAPFPNNPFNYRMDMKELGEYVKTLSDLKQRYGELIDIKIGLEIEFIPKYLDYYNVLKNEREIDILLLGQHFSQMSDGSYTFELKDKSQEVLYLADGIMAGMETGYFDVVAHPDQIFRRTKKWNLDTEELSRKIKVRAMQTGTILEKNISNMFEKKRKNLFQKEFWTDLPIGLETIYGVDAHSIEEMKINYNRQCNLQERRWNDENV